MRITVFTSNQPRHRALICALAEVAEEVCAVQECVTVFPGLVDDFFRRSEVMQRYFARVLAAEAEVFGPPGFLPSGVRSLPVRMGDVSRMGLEMLAPALESDAYVVFGSSWIRGPLCDHLVRHGAVNIHMGISPLYRGSSTNFWALYDRQPQFVGATIHLLSAGLDSGPILCHALPRIAAVDPFVYGMRAVRAAHAVVVEQLASGDWRHWSPVIQDRSQELRYTRNEHFTDAVAEAYLARLPAPADLASALAERDLTSFVRPQVM